MPSVFCATVVSPFTPNLDSMAIEIRAPSSNSIKIRRIRIMTGDGTETAADLDYLRKAKLVLESAAGTGGVSFTPIPFNGNGRTSLSTVNVNGGIFAPGTISNTIVTLSIHSGTDYFWQAHDEGDKIIVAPGGIFGITLNPSSP